MSTEAPTDTPMGNRLVTLLNLLESDPENLPLLHDAAEAALADGRGSTARDLLERYAAIEPLPPSQINLAGLAAMQMGDFETAARHFRSLVVDGESDPAVVFNLAWSTAMLKDIVGATELLDESVIAALPQAAMLRVQLLHDQALFDEAVEQAKALIEIHPDHPGLMAAVSVLALDVDDEALARRCARKAGNHPDALATLGILALGEDRAAEAREMFDRALAQSDDKPRALIGRGLSKLLNGEAASAAVDLDRGAENFGDHLGSWIAAGWAHFIKKDFKTSRDRFEKALDLDPTFAEIHGSLAVLSLCEGDLASAERSCEAALRIDRNCYSGALAQSLLTARAGDAAGSQRIFDMALNMPVGESNRTIAQSLARSSL